MIVLRRDGKCYERYLDGRIDLKSYSDCSKEIFHQTELMAAIVGSRIVDNGVQDQVVGVEVGAVMVLTLELVWKPV